MFSPDLATESSRTRVLPLATSFSSTNKKGTGTLKGFGRRVQVVDQEEALVPRSDPLHFGKVVPGLWDAQSLLFVLDFNEPGLAAVLLTMRPLLGLVVQGLETTVRPVAFEGLETTIRLGQTKILQWL